MRWLGLVGIIWWMFAGGTPAFGQDAVPTAHMRQSTFSIPFNVAGDTTEVQLYVSIDQGVTWHLYAQQRPDTKRFRFRASQDGEFWFASRTVDRQGQGKPATVARPERRVFVDTRQPRLTVRPDVAPSGEIQLDWEIDEEYLAPQTFRVGYRTDANANWQLITVPPPEPSAGKPIHGQAVCHPAAGSRVVQLHVEVADLAGNWAVVEKQVPLTPSGPGLPVGLGANRGPATPTAEASAVPGGSPRGSVVSTGGPLAPDRPGYAAASPVISDGGAAANSGVGLPPPPTSPGISGDERPRMTASRRFSLDYDIESAGPGGVADVELWMTKDRGATWIRHGIDADKSSPFDVEVDADGIYGVRIVIVSGSGLATTAPRSGDPADLWVGVDTTRPTAQFASISYGEGQQAGQLDIRWLADDDHFGPRPITLAYAETSTGPWTTIAAGLVNTGQYFWAADNLVPKRVYLRIEARDEAGNVASQVLDESISLQGLSPSARIKGVQPR